jgi:hypothetical protein
VAPTEVDDQRLGRVAPQLVGLAQRLRRHARHVAQQRIAAGATVAALQALELVGVDQQQRAVLGITPAARPFAFGHLHEMAAVVGAGEFVLGGVDAVALARGVQLEHQSQQPSRKKG